MCIRDSNGGASSAAGSVSGADDEDVPVIPVRRRRVEKRAAMDVSTVAELRLRQMRVVLEDFLRFRGVTRKRLALNSGEVECAWRWYLLATSCGGGHQREALECETAAFGKILSGLLVCDGAAVDVVDDFKKFALSRLWRQAPFRVLHAAGPVRGQCWRASLPRCDL